MIVIYSKNHIPTRITRERWDHITRRHPEMESQKSKIEETISNPELLLKGDFGELLAVRLYPKTPLTKKYLIAVYKEVSKKDGFVMTAYFTNSYSKRRTLIWKP